jgi:hypothetical protein
MLRLSRDFDLDVPCLKFGKTKGNKKKERKKENDQESTRRTKIQFLPRFGFTLRHKQNSAF